MATTTHDCAPMSGELNWADRPSVNDAFSTPSAHLDPILARVSRLQRNLEAYGSGALADDALLRARSTRCENVLPGIDAS